MCLNGEYCYKAISRENLAANHQIDRSIFSFFLENFDSMGLSAKGYIESMLTLSQTNSILNLKLNNNVLFFCLFSSKYFFSHVGTEPPLRTFLGVQHGGGRYRTPTARSGAYH